MRPPKSGIDDWQIKATVHDDRVEEEEEHNVTDATNITRREVRKVVWQRGKWLGRGAFGEVWLQSNQEERRAVKTIPLRSSFTSQECLNELTALLAFSTPEIKEKALFVEFLGWFRNNNSIYLAMEYIELLDLETNLTGIGKLPEAEVRTITRQILSGLQIMHAQSFAHRDLKPQNVMVVERSPTWRVKLADFGLTKKLKEGSKYQTRFGTPEYMAPEAHGYLGSNSESPGYTNAVDLWGVGCIVYRLVTGKVPFQYWKKEKELYSFCQNESQFPSEALDKEVGKTCAEFIRSLLSKLPDDRPSAAHALDDPWITGGLPAGALPELTSCTNPEGTSPKELIELDYRHMFDSKLALAKAYLDDGRITDAIDIFEPVVAVHKELLEENDQVRLAAEIHLATAYLDGGRIRHAIDILEHIIAVQKKFPDELDQVRESLEFQLASAYIEDGQTIYAIEILRRLVAVKNGTKEKDEFRLAYEFQLGRAYLENKQIKEALPILEHVVAVQKETLNEKDMVRLVPETYLARAYLENEKTKDAIKLYEHVVEVRKDLHSETDELRLAGEHALGDAYFGALRFKDSVKILEHVVTVRKETLYETDRFRLLSEHALGAAYLYTRQPKKAIALFEHVVAIMKITLPREERVVTEHFLALAYEFGSGSYFSHVLLLGGLMNMAKRGIC